jgi:hypothetical protein
MSNRIQSTNAATDVPEFIAELDGANFEHKLSIALSEVAAACIDNDKAGEVNVKFAFKRIPGTAQVHCSHTLKFVRPTMDGKSGEEETRVTPLFVGKFGKLTIAPENQMSFLNNKTGEVTA